MLNKLRYGLATFSLVILYLALTPPGQLGARTVTTGGRQAPRQVDAADDGARDAAWRAWDALPFDIKVKVDPRILAELRGDLPPTHLTHPKLEALLGPQPHQPLDRTRFLVYLQHQPDLAALEQQVFASHVDRRTALLDLLIADTEAAQAGVKASLDTQLAAQGVTAYQPFFIVNTVAVEGDLMTLILMAQRTDVARIVANYPLYALQESTFPPATDEVEAAANDLHPSNWNIERVGADRVWAELGVRGEGAVVAGFDTGVEWQHPALAERYRGRRPDGSFDHNYNWFEPDSNLYPGGDLGRSRSSQPYDCSGHGTHTMGTMVGDGGEPGTQIGMAPGAAWIALPGICYRTMPGGIRDDIGALKTFQWLLCPTDLSGTRASADCSKAPDVVNNSWGSANPVNDLLRPAIQRLRAAGIAPVFAAGNPDAGPGSISAPGNAPEAITVGATDREDDIAYFSGRGPSFYPGEQKPELSAPGMHVYSSLFTSFYYAASGTSMAAPHVAGLVALLVSADLRDGRRDLTVDEIERLMTYSARDLGKPGPDNDYGYGRIDAFAAVSRALNSGDLYGVVRDAVTGQPVAGATMVGVDWTSHRFAATANISGVYSTSVPAGTYQVEVSAWGYQSKSYAEQEVFAGSSSVADFALTPLPAFAFSGLVLGEGGAVADALLQVAGHPDRSTRSGADGSYSLTLPTGSHSIVITAVGHRTLTAAVTIGAETLVRNFTLEVAPSILLVEADAAGGWFFAWPLRELYRSALAAEGYGFDVWPIQYTSFSDMDTLPDGSPGYGIPSIATLSTYDVVIWAHNGCSYYWGCDYEKTDANLEPYIAGGGRLIYSAQDAGRYDGTPFFDNLFHADAIQGTAAGEGDTVQGLDFLQGLHLTVTNASLYGYRNGAIDFSPDAVAPQPGDGTAYPILHYDNGGGAAALAVDPCDNRGRALYLATGYENLGPRHPESNPDFAALLGQSLTWLQGQRPARKLILSTPRLEQETTAGATARFGVHVTNAGTEPLVVELSLAGNQWQTQILSGTVAIDPQLQLASCAAATIMVVVTLPTDAAAGAFDGTVLAVTPLGDPAFAQRLELRTVAVAPWAHERPLNTFRYSPGVAALDERSVYAVGGMGRSSFYSYLLTSVERYDPCTQEWYEAPSLPQAFANRAVAALDGKLYVVGGSYSSDSDFGVSMTSTVLVFDPGAETWSTVAPLPTPLAGATAAAANGKLYVFGGLDKDLLELDRVWEYDPATDRWRGRSSMPGGGRFYAAAATLDGKIYVAGGWRESRTVEVYDPANDRWSKAPPLLQGRQLAALVAAPDGALYAIGGLNRRSYHLSGERYDPATARWQRVASMRGGRYGLGAAYAAGRILAVGGWPSTEVESLRVGSSFCLSDKRLSSAAITAEAAPTVTLEILSGPTPLLDAQVVDQLPAALRFAGFHENPLGAVYHADLHQVRWSGPLPANTSPAHIVYGTELALEEWTSGTLISSTTNFLADNGVAFTRTVTSILLAPDFAGTQVVADPARVKSGDVLTYTVQLQGSNVAGGPLSLLDPLPAGVDFVPGSLKAPFGDGAYDPATRTVHWQGVLPSRPLAPNELAYVWGDSNGNGSLPRVEYDWIDISEGGIPVSGYDDVYTCDLPIGFDFTFFGELQRQFCLSTNGFLSFDTGGHSNFVNDCPLPRAGGSSSLIAAIWTDLVILDGMRYLTVGEAPHRQLVVQWSGVRRYGVETSQLAEFQAILYENGAIKIQVRKAGLFNGNDSTTGLENKDGSVGLTYACREPRTLHDGLAVLFAPSSTAASGAEVSFQVLYGSEIGINQWVTNTVTLTTPAGVLQRSTATLANPVDLRPSTMTVNSRELMIDQDARYEVTLRNSGLVPANAVLAMTIPTMTAYVDGSLVCSEGSCQVVADGVQWSGAVAPEQPINLAFAVRVTTPLPDRTALTSIATLDDGFGNRIEEKITFLVRRSDLSATTVELRPPNLEPGQMALVVLHVRNQGPLATNATVHHIAPQGVLVVEDSLSCSAGSCTLTDGALNWQGSTLARSVVRVSYQVQVPPTAEYGTAYTFVLEVSDADWGDNFTSSATLRVARIAHLPFIYMPRWTGSLLLPLIAMELAE
jgi:uncharacterized repeat protein (TIGR01451 family)